MSNVLATIPSLDLADVHGGTKTGVLTPAATALLSLLSQEPLPTHQGTAEPYRIEQSITPKKKGT